MFRTQRGPRVRGARSQRGPGSPSGCSPADAPAAAPGPAGSVHRKGPKQVTHLLFFAVILLPLSCEQAHRVAAACGTQHRDVPSSFAARRAAGDTSPRVRTAAGSPNIAPPVPRPVLKRCATVIGKD